MTLDPEKNPNVDPRQCSYSHYERAEKLLIAMMSAGQLKLDTVDPKQGTDSGVGQIKTISGTPVVVKHFRIKFFFSLAKQDLFPYFFGCLGILFEVKCVCCCIQKRPIYQSLQAVSRTSIDSICLP